MVLRGVRMREPQKKRQFSAILAEELMNFTAVVDSDNTTDLHCEILSIPEK